MPTLNNSNNNMHIFIQPWAGDIKDGGEVHNIPGNIYWASTALAGWITQPCTLRITTESYSNEVTFFMCEMGH